MSAGLGLRRRIDRLDGGNLGDVATMSDAQLLRIIARSMPDAAGFLAKTKREQDHEINRLTGAAP